MADKVTAASPDQEPNSEEKPENGASAPAKPKRRSPERRRRIKKPQERRWDWPKKSYFELTCFDTVETGPNPRSRMKNLVHRLVYVGKLRNDIEDRMEVGTHYDRLLKNLQNNFQTEPMSGLLLVYLKHIVHVLEASSDMITQVMKDLVNVQMGEDGFLENAKILVISHDVPNRLYQNWNFRTLDIQAARMESYESSEGADKIMMDLLSQLLKLGNKLAITPKAIGDLDGGTSIMEEDLIAFKTTLDSLHEKFPDLLPQQAHIHYLMEESDSTMILPEEYLDMYGKPFDVVLESEMVWPLPTKLFPYN